MTLTAIVLLAAVSQPQYGNDLTVVAEVGDVFRYRAEMKVEFDEGAKSQGFDGVLDWTMEYRQELEGEDGSEHSWKVTLDKSEGKASGAMEALGQSMRLAQGRSTEVVYDKRGAIVPARDEFGQPLESPAGTDVVLPPAGAAIGSTWTALLQVEPHAARVDYKLQAYERFGGKDAAKIVGSFAEGGPVETVEPVVFYVERSTGKTLQGSYVALVTNDSPIGEFKTVTTFKLTRIKEEAPVPDGPFDIKMRADADDIFRYAVELTVEGIEHEGRSNDAYLEWWGEFTQTFIKGSGDFVWRTVYEVSEVEATGSGLIDPERLEALEGESRLEYRNYRNVLNRVLDEQGREIEDRFGHNFMARVMAEPTAVGVSWQTTLGLPGKEDQFSLKFDGVEWLDDKLVARMVGEIGGASPYKIVEPMVIWIDIETGTTLGCTMVVTFTEQSGTDPRQFRISFDMFQIEADEEPFCAPGRV